MLWGATQRKRIKVGVLFSNVKTEYGLHGIGYNLGTPVLQMINAETINLYWEIGEEIYRQ